MTKIIDRAVDHDRHSHLFAGALMVEYGGLEGTIADGLSNSK